MTEEREEKRGELHKTFTSCGQIPSLRRDRPYERLNISGVQGLTEAQRASLVALGAIEEDTTSLHEKR